MIIRPANRKRRMRRSLLDILALLALLGLLSLVACGGGDEEQQGSLPAPQEAATRTELPLPETADTTASVSPVTGDVPFGTAEPETVAPPMAAVDPAPEPVSERAPARTPVVEPARGAYSLQLGSFRRPDNATALQARLAELGYDAAVETVVQDGGTLHRVVLYGFADRIEAEQTGEAIHRRLDIEYLIRHSS